MKKYNCNKCKQEIKAQPYRNPSELDCSQCGRLVKENKFNPLSQEISLMLDELLVRAESGDQVAEDLYKKAENYVFGLIGIWENVQDWEEFKKGITAKEKKEIYDEINSKKRQVV